MKEDHQKAFKKLTLFFLSNPVPFNGQNYQKQKGPWASDQLTSCASDYESGSEQFLY